MQKTRPLMKIPFVRWLRHLGGKNDPLGKEKSAPTSLQPPEFLFVHVNKRCNLRCRHCDYWKNHDKDKDRYLRGPRMEQLLTEFSGLNPRGKVVLCGGEKLLDLEDVFLITTTCRRLGLRALGVTNGTLIQDEALAERLILEGAHEISISLNSHLEGLHDQTRGVQGAFSKAVRAIRLLLEARDRLGARDTRIYVMGLVFDDNYEELENFYDFVLNTLGADKLKLNFLQPSFGHATEVDRFFADHARIDPHRLMSILNRCDERFQLGLNPYWKADVALYFRSLAQNKTLEKGWWPKNETHRPICSAYERNIIVDHFGLARLCFSSQFPGMLIEKPGDLQRFWARPETESSRKAMRDCRALCGISHSVRRETSTLASRRPVPAIP